MAHFEASVVLNNRQYKHLSKNAYRVAYEDLFKRKF